MAIPSRYSQPALFLILYFSLIVPSLAGEAPAPSTDILSINQLEPRVRAAAEWFVVAQRADGSFRYGWEPALDQDLLEESLIRQSGAAVALARSASVLKDAKFSNASKSAIHYLLSQTKRSEGIYPTRRSTAPAHVVHPVGYAALLLLAIAEHPDPDESMHRGADELANYLLSRQRDNGSIRLNASDDPDDDDENDDNHPGWRITRARRCMRWQDSPRRKRLAGRSAVRKSRDYFWKYFRHEKEPAFIPWQTAAHAQLVARTKDRASAEFIFEMNDWLVQLQYREKEGRKGWAGGFAAYVDGEKVSVEPGISSASYAESLVDAWRTARIVGDQKRRGSISRGFNFGNQIHRPAPI